MPRRACQRKRSPSRSLPSALWPSTTPSRTGRNPHFTITRCEATFSRKWLPHSVSRPSVESTAHKRPEGFGHQPLPPPGHPGANNPPRHPTLRSGSGCARHPTAPHTRSDVRRPAARRHRSPERRRSYGSRRGFQPAAVRRPARRRADPSDPKPGRRAPEHPPHARGAATAAVSAILPSSCTEKGKEKGRHPADPISSPQKRLSVFERGLVRYGQLLAALRTTGGQHLATVSRSHTSAETVLVDTLAMRRLVRFSSLP